MNVKSCFWSSYSEGDREEQQQRSNFTDDQVDGRRCSQVVVGALVRSHILLYAQKQSLPKKAVYAKRVSVVKALHNNNNINTSKEQHISLLI